MMMRAASYYAIGVPVWYRREAPASALLRGVVADISPGPPPVKYYVRLESKECVWAAFAELRPR
jgi:hypothetical protein